MNKLFSLIRIYALCACLFICVSFSSDEDDKKFPHDVVTIRVYHITANISHALKDKEKEERYFIYMDTMQS